jgi:SCP-2 sterol transfer family
MRSIGRLIRATSDRQLERLFSPTFERAAFGLLARRFDPRAAEGFAGRVVYELERPATGGANTAWTLEIAGAHAVARAGAAPDAALRLRMPVADFMRVALGAVDAAEPVLKNRAKAKGDLALAARLPEIFRSPRPS